MPSAAHIKRKPAETRRKLIETTVSMMLRQGFTATTVDQICAEAGLTKGSFFHYFETKEAIGHAALEWWSQMGTALYEPAWKNPSATPLEQIHRLFDIMIGFTERPGEPVVCLVGMLSQEMAAANPALRESCSSHLNTWTENVCKMLVQAKAMQTPRVDFNPDEVAWFLNSLWQGSMLIAKTQQDPQIIVRNLKRGRAYVDSLFEEEI